MKDLITIILFIVLLFICLSAEIKVEQLTEALRLKTDLVWCLEHTKPVREYQKKEK